MCRVLQACNVPPIHCWSHSEQQFTGLCVAIATQMGGRDRLYGTLWHLQYLSYLTAPAVMLLYDMASYRVDLAQPSLDFPSPNPRCQQTWIWEFQAKKICSAMSWNLSLKSYILFMDIVCIVKYGGGRETIWIRTLSKTSPAPAAASNPIRTQHAWTSLF